MRRNPEVRGRAARLARLLPAGRAKAARTPFVLLVVLLLGGGLIGLLVLNSALSEGSFRLDDLQKGTKNLTDEEQALRRGIDAYSAPDALQRRARQLGMVPGGDPAFLDPDGSVKGVPSPAARQSAARSSAPPEALTSAAPGASPAITSGATPVAPGASPSASYADRGSPYVGSGAPYVSPSGSAASPAGPAAGPPAAASAASVPAPPSSAPRSVSTPTPGR
ncbi:septum formation initiator family protein [Streptomyces sp. NPDC004629]|uniref:septum formation initiator family protein n=1 Tax=Streptomyces sp. NPDC004629 TaxID=3364705 RepID=UPI00367B10FC